MENIDHITITLVISGALILLFAMRQTHKIFRLLQDKRFKRNWRNLFFLMTFFFLGYFGVIYIVLIKEYDILQVLTGVIFFFGAVFVLIVSAMGLSTFKMLGRTNMELESKVNQLRAQNDQLIQFNYATSHDLKEPINTVIGCASILKSEYAKNIDKEGIKFLDFTIKAADRMTELINGLSDYLKVGMKGQKKPTDLHALVSKVMEEMHGSIEQTNARISVSEMPVLQVNEVELKRVFQNLISNAIKYRKEEISPQIEIFSIKREETDGWEFSIQDNGIGIKDKDFPRVFQLFRQLHKDKYEGMGIGLAITRKVVEMHGGTIWVESEEGVGTKFLFTIKG